VRGPQGTRQTSGRNLGIRPASPRFGVYYDMHVLCMSFRTMLQKKSTSAILQISKQESSVIMVVVKKLLPALMVFGSTSI